MKHTILFCILFVISSITSAQSQPISNAHWQTLTSNNADALSLIYDVDLSATLSSVSILSAELVSYSDIFFISYLDSSIQQTGWVLWDTQSEQPILREIIATDQQIDAFSFSPRGQFLIVITKKSGNFDVGETCLWQISSNENLYCWDAPATDFQFTNDEKTLILALDTQIIGWDLQKNEAYFIIPQSVVNIAISPDDTNLILEKTNGIFIWNIQSETPYEVHRQILDDKVIVEDITLDALGRYVFFNTISLFSSGEIELGIWDIEANTVSYIEREVIPQDFFSSQYVRLFLFKQLDSRTIADIIDPITNTNYGTIRLVALRDYTLAQDIYIAREESMSGFTFSVKNLETQETLVILYENISDHELNIQFTSDERFILVYTEEGILQMWGVIAE